MARRNRNIKGTPGQVAIAYRLLSELTPYEGNPRDNEAAIDSVANSIREFGFLVPMVVDDKGVIVAGHTRYEAALSLGMLEAPCVVVSSLTPTQIDAFRVIDNKVSELASWDMDLLSQEISALKDAGIALTGFGWSEEEIDCLAEMVNEDCMSAAPIVDEDGRGQAARASSRAPSTTRIVVGEFVAFVPQQAYRAWSTALRNLHDFDESAITTEILERLGIDTYVEDYRRDNA